MSCSHPVLCHLRQFYKEIHAQFTAAGIFNRQPIGRLFGACIASVLGHARSHAKHSGLAVNCHIGLACTGIAYILYFRLVNRAGPAKALTVTFLIPVFALIYAVLFLNETVTLSMVLLGVVVVFGTAMSSGIFPKMK
jgi:drug/metabolite transporter (DMT)-like permease